jgi:hypothetical protein
MTEIHILKWDKSRAWTDWSGHLRTGLSDLLKDASPSLRLTERKRLSRQILKGEVSVITVENEKYAESLSHILEATGAVVSMQK